MFFQFFGWLVIEKKGRKLWLASMKTLTICEKSSVTDFDIK